MNLTCHWLTVTNCFVRHVPGRHRTVIVLRIIVDMIGDDLALLSRCPIPVFDPAARAGQSVALVNTIDVEPGGVGALISPNQGMTSIRRVGGLDEIKYGITPGVIKLPIVVPLAAYGWGSETSGFGSGKGRGGDGEGWDEGEAWE